jgi:type I restriction enzyme S subunit
VFVGSTVPSLRLDHITDLVIDFPNITIQQKIASFLSALDSKIELNNKINTELETMAKMLYDYWFVQYDFPDEDGNPYKSSGGKMFWNKDLKKDIPEDWEVKSLADITDLSNESVNPFNYPEKEFKHYSIPNFDKSGTYGIEKGYDIKSNKFVVTQTDVLVSKLNPWFNRVIYSTDEDDLISSTEFVIWRTKNIDMKNYLYMTARDPSFITYCINSASGTSHSHRRVNPTVMMKYKVAYNYKIAELFGSRIGSFIKTYANNQVENKSLSDLRDWLLPMLMNGQVRVN